MIDVDHQINAVERIVGTRTLAAGEARVVTIAQTYDTDLADLWDACTNPERIPRWFLPVTGELRVGGRYQLEGNAGGTVESCDPPNAFTATWEFDGDVSWIELHLTAVTPDRTRFVLEHIVHVDNERMTEFGPGAVGVGWELGFLGLALHLSTENAVDPAAFAVWSASDDGKRFATMSSDGWCAANIAAGADPVEARESADRTTAAYTTF